MPPPPIQFHLFPNTLAFLVYLVSLFPSLLVSLPAFVPGIPLVFLVRRLLHSFQFACLVIHPTACKHWFSKVSSPHLPACLSVLGFSLL